MWASSSTISSLDMLAGQRESVRADGADGKLEGERGAAADALALGERAAAVPLRRLRHDEEAQTRAFHALRQRPRRAIEAAEDALGFVGRNADALIAHADHREVLLGPCRLRPPRARCRGSTSPRCPAG